MPTNISFDPTRDLETREIQATYLAHAFAAGDALIVVSALQTIAQARGMSLIVGEDPRLDALFGVLDQLGFDLVSVARKPSPPWGT